MRTHMYTFSYVTLKIVESNWNCFRCQGSSLPVFTKFDNPASASTSPLARYLTYLALPSYNIGLLLAPVNLCCDWTMGSIPLVTDLSGVVKRVCVWVTDLISPVVSVTPIKWSESISLVYSFYLKRPNNLRNMEQSKQKGVSLIKLETYAELINFFVS